MKLLEIRRSACEVADLCYTLGGLIGLSGCVLLEKLNLMPSGSGAGAAFGMWAIGILATGPFSLPFLFLGWVIDKVFRTDPIREENRETRRREAQEAIDRRKAAENA